MKTKKRRRKNVYLYLMPALALMLCVGLLVNLVVPDRSYSQVENRPLASWPSISASQVYNGTWQQEMNVHFADQFVGRQTYFHVNYLARKFLGQREINDVFLGRGSLLGQNETGDEAIIKGNVDAINAFAAASGIPTYFMVVPGAATIQSQLLPMAAPVNKINATYASMYKQLANGVIGVDVKPVLDSHSKDYIYYHSDHHWTSLGAGLAYAELAKASGVDFSLDNYQAMPVSTSFQGTLASKTGSLLIKDEINIYPAKDNPDYVVTWADGTKTTSIYDSSALNQKDQYEVFLSKNQAMVNIQTTNDNDKHLLVFKDSYANSMVQFMLPHYQSITIVDPRYYYENIELVLNLNRISEIAVVYSWNTFVTDSAIQDVLNPYVESWQSEQQESQEETE